jgi:hypothetical protein
MAHYDRDEPENVEVARNELSARTKKAEADFEKSIWRQRAKFIREATVKERANLQRELRRKVRPNHG